MSIKTRLRSIEKSRYRPQPWLVLTFLEPTQSQLEEIAQALKIGRFVVIFNPLTAGVWISGSDDPGWWQS